jgi:hypothetical protein
MKRVETNQKIEVGDVVRDNTGLALAVQSISNNEEGVFLVDEGCEAEEYLCEIIGMTLEKHNRLIKEKDQEINALQIAHVKQESDNMVLRKYLKEVYDVLDRYQAFQLSGKTEGERAKETDCKGGNER